MSRRRPPTPDPQEENLPAYEDNNQEICFICRSHGHLVICDNCFRSYHHNCVKGIDLGSDDQPWFCQICSQLNKCFGCKGEVLQEQALKVICTVCYRTAHNNCFPEMPSTEFIQAIYRQQGFRGGVCKLCRHLNEPLDLLERIQREGQKYIIVCYKMLHSFVVPQAQLRDQSFKLCRRPDLIVQKVVDIKESKPDFPKNSWVKILWRQRSIEQSTWQNLWVINKLCNKIQPFRYNNMLMGKFQSKANIQQFIKNQSSKAGLQATPYNYQALLVQSMMKKFKKRYDFYIALSDPLGGPSACLFFINAVYKMNPVADSIIVIVCDRSLVYYWAKLAQNLVPHLDTVIYQSSEQARQTLLTKQIFYENQRLRRKHKSNILIMSDTQLNDSKYHLRSLNVLFTVVHSPLRILTKSIEGIFRKSMRIFLLEHDQLNEVRDDQEIRLINLIDASGSIQIKAMIEDKSVTAENQRQIKSFINRFRENHVVLMFSNQIQNQIARTVRISINIIGAFFSDPKLDVDRHSKDLAFPKLTQALQIIKVQSQNKFVVICDFNDPLAQLQNKLNQLGITNQRFNCSLTSKNSRVVLLHSLFLTAFRLKTGYKVIILSMLFNFNDFIFNHLLDKHDSLEIVLLLSMMQVQVCLAASFLKINKCLQSRSRQGIVVQVNQNKRKGVSPSTFISNFVKQSKPVRKAGCQILILLNEKSQTQQFVSNLAGQIDLRIKRHVLSYLLQFGIEDQKEGLRKYLIKYKRLKEDQKVGEVFCHVVIQSLQILNSCCIRDGSRLYSDEIFHGYDAFTVFRRIKGLTLLRQLVRKFQGNPSGFKIEHPKYRNEEWSPQQDFELSKHIAERGFDSWRTFKGPRECRQNRRRVVTLMNLQIISSQMQG